MALLLLVFTHCCTTWKNINEDAQWTETKVADTVVIYRTDTIIEHIVKYKDKKVVDTLYIEKEQDTFLLLVQKHFQSKGLYDVWVSGVEPLGVDSVKVYPKTEYQYVTQTKTIYDKKGTDIYGTVGFSRFNGFYSSNIGIYATTNRKWLYGAEIGLMNGSFYFGAKFGFNINNK